MTIAVAAAANRSLAFWAGVAAVSGGVALHLPMLAVIPGGQLGVMAMGGTDPAMVAGMVLILVGIGLAGYALLPPRVAVTRGEIAVATRDGALSRAHVAALVILSLALVIDTMKPATIGFVLPGLRREYVISRQTAALLPLFALTGTVVGSFAWGVLADRYGRKASILLSSIIFIGTAICGAMPSFYWNLAMCFVMGASAGGMLPVAYTLLAEIIPPRARGAMLVLVGGTGLIGGYLAASGSATLFEPRFGWRLLWLQGFPTGVLLVLLSRFIPESPRFLHRRGDDAALARLVDRFGLVITPVDRATRTAPTWTPRLRVLTAALLLTALAWSFVNFGLLLWLPSDLQARGYAAGAASALIAKSTLIALPTIGVAALLYSRWSTKWTLVGTVAVTLAGLVAAVLGTRIGLGPVPVLVLVLLIVGVNGLIAVLLPYAAERYPESIRGRATGLIAAGSKFGGVVIQLGGLAGFVPGFGPAALVLVPPVLLAAGLVAWFGVETRGTVLGRGAPVAA